MFFKNVKFYRYPTAKEKVIFQCDELYFTKYAFYNLISCNNAGHDVHIHFINPSQKFLDKVDNIKLEIDLSITTEELAIENINYYKLKSYYFCSRYFVTDLLFSKGLIDKAYVVDADIIINEKISFEEKIQLGVLYYPNYTNYWKQTGANFLYVCKSRQDFITKIIQSYLKKLEEVKFEEIHEGMEKYVRSNMYGLDQVCMSLQMSDENVEDEKFLNLSSVDNFISKTPYTKIWSFTGAGTKQNPDLQNILISKFKKSF
jgi:hypothetical protein